MSSATFLLDDPLVAMHEWREQLQLGTSATASDGAKLTAQLNAVVLLVVFVGICGWFLQPTIHLWLITMFALLMIGVFRDHEVKRRARRDAAAQVSAQTTPARSEGFVDGVSELTPNNPFGNPNQIDVQDRPTRAAVPEYSEAIRDSIYAAALQQLRNDPKQAAFVAMLDAGDRTAQYAFIRSLYAFHTVPVSSVANDGQDALYASFRQDSARVRAKEAAVTRWLKH